MKGNSLRIEPEEAKIVRMIYDMYGEQGIGYNTIAYQLNQLNIPALPCWLRARRKAFSRWNPPA